MNTFARQDSPGRAMPVLQPMPSEGSDAPKLSSELCEFLCMTIHELKNPLAAISGFSQTLLQGIESDTCSKEEQREFLSIVVDECDRLQRLVNDLNYVSKVEAGRVPTPVFTEVDLAALLMRVAQVQSQAHVGRDIELRLCPDLPPVFADEDCLEGVFTNLLDNAFKYSPAGGLVRVSAWCENGKAMVGVQDQGVGIPADEVERIFEKFHRVKCGATAHIAGTGLGLYIVRHVVEEMHRGRVWCESELGKGTTFRLELPLLREST